MKITKLTVEQVGLAREQISSSGTQGKFSPLRTPLQNLEVGEGIGVPQKSKRIKGFNSLRSSATSLAGRIGIKVKVYRLKQNRALIIRER